MSQVVRLDLHAPRRPRPTPVQCPAYGSVVPGLAPSLRHVGIVMLGDITCPACGQQWKETRARGEPVQQFYKTLVTRPA